ncbi:MAG: metallophosphoesterase [Candidatus Angelobacter sp.]
MSADRLVGFREPELCKAAESLYSSPIVCDKDQLTVLQLSDVHFNNEGSFRFKRAPGTPDAPSLATKVSEALSSAGLKLDAVIISGDFAFKDTHNELETYAKKELDALRDQLGIPFQRWIVIPGNHDISWGAEKYAKASGDRSSIYPDKTKDYFGYVYRRIQLEKASPLADELKKWESDSEDDWKSNPIRHYMPSYAAFQLKSGQFVEIHGYNSCLVEGADWPGIGFIGNGQPKLFEFLSGLKAASAPIKIGVLHHHVKEVSRIVKLPEGDVAARMEFSLIADSRALIDKLIANGYSMLLHGHQHQPFISQETRPCYGSDPASDTWHRDYLDEKILIFGAGSVSFWPPDDTRTDNAFFVHQIDNQDHTVTTWNFTMGAGDDQFQRREPCRQFLRGSFTPEFIRKRLGIALTRVEKANFAAGDVKVPQPCDTVDRMLGNSVHEILAAIGALTRNGEKYDLSLLLTQPGDDRNRGGTANLPARFANLLRLALEFKHPLFPSYWTLPPNREEQPHIFNTIRWASLNLAQGILKKDSQKFFTDARFEKQVLNEYPGDMELPHEFCPARYFVGCVVVRQAASKRIELLLRSNDEWRAKLLPVIEISDLKQKQWEGGTTDSKSALARPVFAGIISPNAGCEIVELPSGADRVEKKQISPSKGVWNHYLFNLCFMKFDASARKALGKDESFTFVPIDEIREIWEGAAKESEQGNKWLEDPVMRAAVANRKLITKVLDLLKNPDPNWFYELN